MQETLTRDNVAFEGRAWCAVIYTPESPGMPQRVVALLPTERQAFQFIDQTKSETDRHRVVRAALTPAGAWTVEL